MQSKKNIEYKWKISDHLIDYEESITEMENYVENIINNNAIEKIWLLEHNDIYTAGVSTPKTELENKNHINNTKIIPTKRGGKITYHGPGIKIAYIMLNLKKRNQCDIRKYVNNLEQLIINILKHYDIKGYRRKDRIGIWIPHPKDNNKENKIAAIGVRVRKWVSYHGIAINMNPNLEQFNYITPCGISSPQYGVTSIEELGININKKNFNEIFVKEFNKLFNKF